MGNTVDANNIAKQVMDIYAHKYGLIEHLGYTKEGSTNVNFGLTYHKVEDTSQTIAPVKFWFIGAKPVITTTAMELNYDKFRNLYFKEISPVATDGTNHSIGLFKEDVDLTDSMPKIVLHPRKRPLSDKSEDITFWKGHIMIDGEIPMGSRENVQSATVTIEAVYDSSAPAGWRWGVIGDPNLTMGVPDYLFLTAGKVSRAGQKSINAIGAGVGYIDMINCFSAWKTDGTISADVESAGASSSASVIPFVNLSTSQAFAGGDYLLLDDGAGGEEVCYVESVEYLTDTTGNLNVRRGVWGTTAVTLDDGDSIAQLDGIGVLDWTDYVDFSSGTPATAVIGNTYEGSGVARKGVIQTLAAGSTNITAKDSTNTKTSNTLALSVS